MSDEEEFDLDASMAETMKEIQEKDEDATEHEPEAEGDVSEEPEAEESTEVDSAGEEDSSGEAEGGSASDEDSGEEPEEQADEEGEADVSRKNPPVSWRASSKDKWEKVDPEIQDEILKREEDMAKGVQQVKDKAEYGDRINTAIQPYMAMIQSMGGTPEDFVSGMGNTFYTLRTGTQPERLQVIRNMAQMAGVDISNIQPPSPQEQQMQPVMQEINRLRQQINQQSQMSTINQETEIKTALTSFENEVDENGALVHPYFHNVEREMVAIIPQIRESNPGMSHKDVLQKAYDNSIWANPETRQQLQLLQEKEKEAKRKQTEKARAAKAAKANKVNTDTRGEHDSKTPEKLGSIDDTMAETMKNIKSR